MLNTTPASPVANGSACQSRLLPSARFAPMQEDLQGASSRPCGTAWGLPPGHHAVPLSAGRNTYSRYYKDINISLTQNEKNGMNLYRLTAGFIPYMDLRPSSMFYI